MIKIKEDKNMIIMTRGDTLLVKISIVNEDTSEEYIPVEGDSLRFALKKKYNDEEPLILKSIPIDTCILRLEPEDTKVLDQPGDYVYDIQLTYGDGLVYTVIAKATLRIQEEVE